MRPVVKADVAEHYGYFLLYADNAFVVSENDEKVLRNEIGKYIEIKHNPQACQAIIMVHA